MSGFPFNAFAEAILSGASIAMESAAEGEALRLQSEEWRRALRSVEAQRVDALEQGARQAGMLRSRAAMMQGQQRLAFAGGNVDASSGTAAQTQLSTALYGELDAQTAKNNARRVALGHARVEQQLRDEGAQSALAVKQRAQARALRVFQTMVSFGSSGMGGK